MAFGAFIGSSHGVTFYGLNIAVIRVFRGNSNFPLSLSGGSSFILIDSQKKDVFTGLKKKDVGGALGINYTQTFFAKKTIYPAAGVSAAFDLSEFQQSFSACVGLNVRLGKERKKSK